MKQRQKSLTVCEKICRQNHFIGSSHYKVQFNEDMTKTWLIGVNYLRLAADVTTVCGCGLERRRVLSCRQVPSVQWFMYLMGSQLGAPAINLLLEIPRWDETEMGGVGGARSYCTIHNWHWRSGWLRTCHQTDSVNVWEWVSPGMCWWAERMVTEWLGHADWCVWGLPPGGDWAFSGSAVFALKGGCERGGGTLLYSHVQLMQHNHRESTAYFPRFISPWHSTHMQTDSCIHDCA